LSFFSPKKGEFCYLCIFILRTIMNISSILSDFKGYFNIRSNKEDEALIVEQVESGITFRGGNLWVLICAILIASLGLNVNSTAVIIGAMLISPLMGPIIGMGFALGIGDLKMLKRAFKNYGVATLISIVTATVYFIVSPLNDAQSELLARTSPTLYDVLIAFFGGAAGVIALCTKVKGNVIPGVAIATALMPPLCTAGFGLGTGQLNFFFGAFYLFFINTVFIALATYGGVRLLHIGRKSAAASSDRLRKNRRLVSAILAVALVPAAITTINVVRQSVFDNNVHRFVKNELSIAGTQIISSDANRDTKTLRVVAVGQEIKEEQRLAAEGRLKEYNLDEYNLSIIQGAQGDFELLSSQLLELSDARQQDLEQMKELAHQRDSYQQRLDEYTHYDQLADELAKEAEVLFPKVKDVNLALTAMNSAEGDSTRSYYVTAVVHFSKAPAIKERVRIHSWLHTRVAADSLLIVER